MYNDSHDNSLTFEFGNLDTSKWRLMEFEAINYHWRVWVTACDSSLKVYFIIKALEVGCGRKVPTNLFQFDFVIYTNGKTSAEAQRVQGTQAPYFLHAIELLETASTIAVIPSLSKECHQPLSLKFYELWFPRTVNTDHTELTIQEYQWALNLINHLFQPQGRKLQNLDISVEFLNDTAEFLGDRLLKNYVDLESQNNFQVDASQVSIIKGVFHQFYQDGDLLDEAIQNGTFQLWRNIFLLSIKSNRDLSLDALRLSFIFHSLTMEVPLIPMVY